MKQLVNSEGYKPESVYNIYGREVDTEETRRDKLIIGAHMKAQAQINKINILDSQIKHEDDELECYTAKNFLDYKKLFSMILGKNQTSLSEIRLIQ